MDPNKSASAPPLGCADDKSAPPPYQESYHPGFPQPEPGYYPQPGPGYYPQPGPGYYSQPAPGYPPHPGSGYPPHPGPEYPPHPAPGYSPQAQVCGPPPQYAAAGYGQLHPVGQQYPRQPAVTVTYHPTVYMTHVPLSHPVKDYLCWSIFTMVLCMPLGIAALIHSISTREANHAGDRMSAERASMTARILNQVGLLFGLTFTVLIVVFIATL